MDLLNNLALGFSTAFSLTNLLYCFIGVTLGTLIGVLPGLGPVATLAMLLPITYSLDPTAALIMLAGIYYGSQYGGSTTAILEPSRRVSLSRNLLRRLSNGKKRQSRHCLRSCRHRLFHCRLFCYCLGRCFRSSVD